MKSVLMMVIIALAFPAGPILAQPEWEFGVSPVFAKHLGHTEFELNVQPEGPLYTLGSKLVFPLDQTQAGLQFGFRVVDSGRSLWSGEIRALFAMSDPGKLMTDVDWITVDNYRWDFSSTESPVEGSLTDIEVKGTRLLYAGKNFELSALLGIGYQKIKQKMLSFEGWQRLPDDSGNLVYYIASYDSLCLTYEARFVRPQIGLVPRVVYGSFTAELQAILSPLTYVKDIDDHVLRDFQIRTDGTGFGFGGKVDAQYTIPRASGLKPFFRLSGELFKVSIDASGFRHVYGGEAGEGYEVGELYPEDHKIRTTQGVIQLAAGIKL